MGTPLKTKSHESSSCSTENLDTVIRETRTKIFGLKRVNYSTQSEQNRTHPTPPASAVVISETCMKCFVESLHAKLRIDSGTPASRWNNHRAVPPLALHQSQSTQRALRLNDILRHTSGNGDNPLCEGRGASA